MAVDLVMAAGIIVVDAALLIGFVFIGQFFVQDYSIFMPLLVPGAFQFLYKLPLLIFFGATKRKRALRVLAYSAALVVLLNGACFGFIIVSAKMGG